jgi:molybdate transport system substrate-binding protein
MVRRFLRALVVLLALGIAHSGAAAGKATVAVAANFAGTLGGLQKAFEADGNHQLTIISGATGKLTAQITEGAPFDVFLSADDKATKKLIESGAAVAGSEFTYATGVLALFSADPQIATDGPAALDQGKFARLAIANPKLAPYGTAAEQTMMALGVYDRLKTKLVMGENVGQTFAMIDSGAAELGFVALSQVLSSEARRKGSYWVVPAHLHAAILQNAVLLSRADRNDAARAFLDFLKSPQAREPIRAAGYAVTPDQ